MKQIEFYAKHQKRGCVISLDNGNRGRAESPKAPSPGHRPGLGASALSGRIGSDL